MSDIENRLFATEDKTLDKDARIAELEKQLHSQQVESGRLKKISEELKAARDQIHRMETDRSRDRVNSIQLSQDIEEVMPSEIKQGAAIIADSYAKGYSQDLAEKIDRQHMDYDERLRRIEESAMRRSQLDIEQAINSKYPGFLSSVGPGGDKYAAWQEYLKHNKSSIASAYSNLDMPTIFYHIQHFYQEAGVNPLSNQGSAVPDPSNSGGSFKLPESGSPGRSYTLDEYSKLMDKVEDLRFSNPEKSRQLYSELHNAVQTGRVKG